jgi:phage minor structural protein
MDINTNEIKLFTKNETNFNHNGKILNEATSCYVTESLDGIFDLDLEYPLNDKKQLSGDLVRENIIKSVFSQTDSRGEQLFTIRKRSLNTKNNRINIYAQAKARRDLDMNMVLGVETTSTMNRKQASQMLLNKCVEQKGYYIGNLDTNPNTNINLGLDETTGAVINYLDISGISALKAFLSDSENSIYKAYGGEIIYNNFEINMVDERGTDNNILIESGKNLEELQQDIDDLDTENFATAVLPCSADGVYLPNSEIIYSPNAAALGKVFKRIVYDDVTLVSDTPEAFNVVYAQLRERVQKDFNNGLDKLKINNTIKYIQLLNTEEYKPYAKLFTEKCEIGNNVTVRYYMTNDKTKYIDAVGRVVKIKFNVLKNRIEEIEIGDRKKKSVLDVITNTTSNVTTVNNKTNTNKSEIKKVKKSTSDLRTEFTVADGKISAIVEEGEISGSWVLRKDSLETTFKKTDSYSKFTQTSEQVDAVVEQGDYTGTWKLRADSVETAFRDTDSNTRLTQNTEQIDAVVQQGSSTGTWKLRADSVMQAINDDSGVHSTTLNSDGLSVKNGAFTIYDDSGNVIFRINTNGAVGIKDLDMMNSNLDEYSYFYQTIRNMQNLRFQDISCNSIYINGKSLDQYILDVVG